MAKTIGNSINYMNLAKISFSQDNGSNSNIIQIFFKLQFINHSIDRFQDYAIYLSTQRGIEIQFLSWTDIEKHIHKFPQLRSLYYPHLSSSNGYSIPNQTISNNIVYGHFTQIGRDLNIVTQSPLVIKTLPLPGSIGSNYLLKQSISMYLLIQN